MTGRRAAARRAAVLGLLCAALTAASCRSTMSLFVGAASDTWTRTYPLTPGGEVDITNIDGSIDVQGTAGTQVTVTAERTVRAATSEEATEALKALVIRENVTPDRVSLQQDNPPGDVRAEIAFHVKVPIASRVNLTTGNGALTALKLDGPVNLKTTNGRIQGRAMSGSVNAQTVNGAIMMEFDAIELDRAPMALTTTNGNILVGVPRTGKVDLSARCVHGSVSVSSQLPIELDVQSPQRFEGRLNSGGTRLLMQTDNGTIRITPRS